MVVKSVYVSGQTDQSGIVKTSVDYRTANLQENSWRMCVDSLVITFPDKFSGPISVCTNLTYTYEGSGTNIRLRPAKLLVYAINVTENSSKHVNVVSVRKKEWINFSNADASDFQLIFENLTNSSGLAGLNVYCVLLFERLQ
jgi:hypothetical protein